jgi:peptide deformylase
MAVRRIVYFGDPVLRRKASRVRRIDDEICSLLDEMAETMLENEGLGLAAAQVGESTAVVVVRRGAESDGVIELINPRIVESEGEERDVEGCLSLPTLRGEVVRPTSVAVEAVNREGEEIAVEGEGMMARCLVHELDHLAGTLFIDAVEADSLYWLRPDDREDTGYRSEPTTLEEAEASFERLRQQREGA